MDENTTNVFSRKRGAFTDLIGMKFGKLSVTKLERRIAAEGRGYKRLVYWECLCECGKTKTIRDDHLKTGATTTCGCAHRVSGQRNKGWKGCGELPGHYFCHLKHRAKQFGREFDLTPEFLWDLYLKQDRKCGLSGLPIEFFPQKKGRSTASMDRIFSEYGYTKSNVEWVHRDINLMKNRFRPDIFHWYCTLVAEYNLKNYEPLPLSS